MTSRTGTTRMGTRAAATKTRNQIVNATAIPTTDTGRDSAIEIGYSSATFAQALHLRSPRQRRMALGATPGGADNPRVSSRHRRFLAIIHPRWRIDAGDVPRIVTQYPRARNILRYGQPRLTVFTRPSTGRSLGLANWLVYHERTLIRFDVPGFYVIDLSPKASSESLRQVMLTLKDGMREIHNARTGRDLVFLSAGRFDQQVTTRLHRDGGPDEQVLEEAIVDFEHLAGWASVDTISPSAPMTLEIGPGCTDPHLAKVVGRLWKTSGARERPQRRRAAVGRWLQGHSGNARVVAVQVVVHRSRRRTATNRPATVAKLPNTSDEGLGTAAAVNRKFGPGIRGYHPENPGIADYSHSRKRSGRM